MGLFVVYIAPPSKYCIVEYVTVVSKKRVAIDSSSVVCSLETVIKMFSNINKLLLTLAVLPVSTASLERSFSTLKKLKTYTILKN